MQPLNTAHPVEHLLATRQPSLAFWYGEPLGADAAALLQRRAQTELQSRLCGNRPVFPLHVLQLVCGFWRHTNSIPCYAALAGARSRRERALLELVQGQLLASRKLYPAGLHLAHGFALAAPWLAAAEYFELLRRHQMLAGLRLTESPAPAQVLAELLSEAKVSRRLRDGERPCRTDRHRDTVG
jgi:hypothetical protein